MNSKLSINLTIADRKYSLSIDREEEEVFRAAAKKINERVLQYKEKRYKDRDTQDYLAFASLQYVMQLIKTEQRTDIVPILKELNNIDKMLGDFINQE